MSSFQKLNDEEIEQSEMKNKLDLITIVDTINLDAYASNVVANNNKLLGNTPSGLKTLIDANTAKTGITTDQATKIDFITVTSNKNLDVLHESVVSNSTNISSLMYENIQQGTDIGNIELKTDYLDIGNNGLKYDYGNFLTGAMPPNQLLIQHSDLNNGSLSTTDYSIRVTQAGELRLNVPTGQDFEFRINNIMQFNNTQIKNLVDNVSITQNVNLDTIESDVSSNNAKISADNVNNCDLTPLSRYCYGNRVKTPTNSTNSINLTSSFQDLIYRSITTNGITYNETTGLFSVATTGIYKVEAQVSYTCGSGPERRMTLKLVQGGNTIIRARDNAARLESSSNTDNTLILNGMCRLVSSLNYKFQIQSSNTGSAVISNAPEDCNSLCIQGMVLNSSTTIPTNWGNA